MAKTTCAGRRVSATCVTISTFGPGDGTTASHNNVKEARTERLRCSGIGGHGTNKGIAWRFIAATITTPSMIASVQYSP